MNKASQKVILENVRGSYVYLDQVSAKSGKYGMQVLMDKDGAAYKKAKKAHDKVLAEAFGEKALKQPGKYKFALRDADEEGREGAEYGNVIFFNANNNKKPGLVNRNNEPADADDIEEYCYSGAYFHVSVTFASYPARDGGKPGVGAYVNNVMLRKKGERLDGSASATNDFADFADFADDVDESDDFDDDDL